jgi:hypothetical protein
MKRQTSATLILCGTLLSLALGCSKGDGSSDLAANDSECSPLSAADIPVAGQKGEDGKSSFEDFLQPVGQTEVDSVNQKYCLDKNLDKMLRDGTRRLVDDNYEIKYYPDDYRDPRLRGKPMKGISDCWKDIPVEKTDRDREAIIEAQRAAGNYSKPSFDAGKAANAAAIKKCGPSVRERVEGNDPNDPLGPNPASRPNITEGQDLGAGVPAPAAAVPTTGNPSTLAEVLAAQASQKQAINSQTTTPQANGTQTTTTRTDTNCTGTGLKTEGAQLGSLNCPDQAIKGNDTLTGTLGLTAPK